MDTLTLDQRLRVRAQEKLGKRIEQNFSAAIQECRIGHTIWVKPEEVTKMVRADYGIPLIELLTLCQNSVYAEKRNEAEESEIREFLTRIDQMQESLDELRGEVQQ